MVLLACRIFHVCCLCLSLSCHFFGFAQLSQGLALQSEPLQLDPELLMERRLLMLHDFKRLVSLVISLDKMVKRIC